MADNKPQKMDDSKLGQFIDNELANTIGFGEAGDEVSNERDKNLRYYLNRPLGDEMEGRSQLQDSSVQDVVETLLPDTLAPFISAERVVEFNPVGKEDEEFAELAGEYINHIFLSDNDGVSIQYTWQKDAFLQKNGFVYADWTELERVKRQQVKVYYAGLQELTEDEEVEILEVAAFDGNGNAIDPKLVESAGFDPVKIASTIPMDITPEEICFEVDFRRRWKEGRVKVCNIPPEFVVVSNTATTVEDANIIGWFERVTISRLREEGYPEELIAKIPADNSHESDMSGERSTREQAQGGQTLNKNDDSTDPASRKVWRSVLWTHVDYDGDGKAELRKIVRAGARQTGGMILLNEEADDKPVVSFTPVPMPHQLFGRCPADQTVQVQDGKTAMLRAAMDGTYATIEPRYAYIEELASEDTWDDLMLGVPGAPIRMLNPGAVAPIADAPDLASAYQMLEYFDRIRESRTPVSRQDQGIDPDVLKDKTAREATIQANASARRKELILRLYAESLGKLFKLILKLTIKHQDRPRQLRLMNRYMEVDPRFWNADMDVTVSVGLGTGTKDQQLQGLMAIHQIQMGDVQMGLPTVDPAKLYNTRAKLVEYQGLTSPELYFNDPADPESQPQEQQQPSPEEVEAQKQAEAEQVQQSIEQAREQGKKEAQDEIKLIELQAKERMHAKDLEVDWAELGLKREEAAIKADLDSQKMEQSSRQAVAKMRMDNASQT